LESISRISWGGCNMSFEVDFYSENEGIVALPCLENDACFVGEFGVFPMRNDTPRPRFRTTRNMPK
ncbi:MAG: hypothetical protein ACK5UX_05540, partial [Burkholderiales bacterium]